MAEQPQDFLTFEQALNQLRLKEEELKRLVSEGEIRAFREGETMKLRRTDVDHLRRSLGGDELDVGEATQELVFDDDADLQEAGLATEEITEVETLLDDDVREAATVAEEEVEEELEAAAVPPPPRGDRVVEGPLFLAVTVLTTVVLALALPIAISASSGSTSSLAKSIADNVAGLFGAK